MRALQSIIICWLLALPLQALANGFQLPDQSVRAVGMADAFTAVADDASAVWYNPAGIAFQQQSQISLGMVNIYIPSVDFTSNSSNPFLPLATTAQNKRQNAIVPHVYMSYVDPTSDVSFALGINSPFGLETDWTGTALADASTFSRIQMININPTIAYKVNDHFAIAFGVDYTYVKDVDLNNSILTQHGNGDGWGANIGLLYKAERFNLALTYRSQIAVQVNGTTSSTLGGRASASTSFKFPDMLNVGIAVHPTETLTISVEADWVNWGKYDQVALNYSSPITIPTGLPVPPLAAVRSIVLQKQWHATISPKIGLTWQLDDAIQLRLGYSFDPSPVNDRFAAPDMPINDQHNFSVGLGFHANKHVSYDLAYMYTKQITLNQTAPTGADALGNGRYTAQAHLFGAAVNYQF
ncbi:TonB-dependent receptor [Mariprofundus ferrooxydans]|nr:TonB-dependent receptor [Mariprofundus ferrooxydans]